MGGGLMQLVAYGAQDIYLTSNPQITFFKVVYRRHTNFSMEAIEQTWNGTSTGVAGESRCTATVSRNGDLVTKMYMELDGTPTVNDQNPTAQGIVNVEVEIGGQRIDRQSGQWMNVYAHLTEPNPSGHVGQAPTANSGTLFQNNTGMGGCLGQAAAAKFFVPLMFWFNRNPGLALPLIALQYHEVKVILTHNWARGFDALTSNRLWADYIYLDTEERRRFAQVSHEYLIEQVQESSVTAGGTSELTFNHPVKELVWCVDAITGSLAALGTNTGTYQLKLNGHDRFAARDFRYFTRTQVHAHHTGPGGLTAVAAQVGSSFSDGIGVYSFALKPEEHQPSGTCNFSRIDNAQLVQTGDATATMCYAVNYNVLRVMSGMGGLAYSN